MIFESYVKIFLQSGLTVHIQNLFVKMGLINQKNGLSGCVAKLFEIRDNARFLAIEKPMTSFKGAHFPKDVILYSVFSMSVMVSIIVI
jgi:hypothetical protein